MPRKSAYQQKPDRAVPRLVKYPSLSMAQLAASTDMADRQKSASVRLVNLKPVRAPVGLRGYSVVRGDTLTAENQHQHSVRLFWSDDPDNPGLRPDTPVIVDCTCPRHAFFYEVANARAGCSFIYRSNGKRPTITNPGLQVGLCKHAYRMMSYQLRLTGRRRRTGEALEALTAIGRAIRSTGPRPRATAPAALAPRTGGPARRPPIR